MEKYGTEVNLLKVNKIASSKSLPSLQVLSIFKIIVRVSTKTFIKKLHPATQIQNNFQDITLVMKHKNFGQNPKTWAEAVKIKKDFHL